MSTNSVQMLGPVSQNRELAYCVAVSLLLHALLLLLPGMRAGSPAAATATVLTATFAPRTEPAESVPAPDEAVPRREREAAVPRPEVPPQPKPSRPILASPQPAAPSAQDASGASAAPTAPVDSGAGASMAAAGAAVPVATRPAQSAPAAGAGTARSDGDADAGTLDQYRLALIVAARRYKRYPAQAMDKGWQGKVEIRLVIGANGAIQSSIVRASSGYEVLDNQALDMVKKAKPLAPIPAALRGREFTVDIPVIFDLQTG